MDLPEMSYPEEELVLQLTSYKYGEWIENTREQEITEWKLVRTRIYGETLYICKKNGNGEWIESTESLAFQKFMNIIPNQIINK